jgi:hypothetical protein
VPCAALTSQLQHGRAFSPRRTIAGAGAWTFTAWLAANRRWLKKNEPGQVEIRLPEPGVAPEDAARDSLVAGVAIVFRENNLPGQGHPPATNCFH